MNGEVIGAWVAAAAAIGSAGVAWAAQLAAARLAKRADENAAIIGAKTEVWTSDKAIYVEQVTAERAVWRSEMRATTSTLVAVLQSAEEIEPKVKFAEIAQIRLRLNPAGRSEDALEQARHPLDKQIHLLLDDIADLKIADDESALLGKRLEGAVALLIKQEWDKSKREADRENLRVDQTTSKSPAAPIPPAVHIDTTT